MRVATWNVNSVKARLPRLLDWLAGTAPDVVCLQETKCPDGAFPVAEVGELGYTVASHSDGRWNGVAILSRVGLTDVTVGFPGQPGFPEPEARAISATCGGVRVWSIYVPNGRSPDDPHYTYKLAWFAALRDALADELHGHEPHGDAPADEQRGHEPRGRELRDEAGSRDLREEAHADELRADRSGGPGDGGARPLPLAVCGDFNVAPTDADVWDPAVFTYSTHVTPAEREALTALRDLGLTDVVPTAMKGPHPFTYWDYRAGMFHQNKGMRIDLVYASAPFADAVRAAYVDREARKGKGSSDHAPIVVDVDLDPGTGVPG